MIAWCPSAEFQGWILYFYQKIMRHFENNVWCTNLICVFLFQDTLTPEPIDMNEDDNYSGKWFVLFNLFCKIYFT